MNGGFISSPQSSPVVIPPRFTSKSYIKPCIVASQSWSSSSNLDYPSLSWDLKSCMSKAVIHSRIRLRCRCSSSPGGPFGQGENDSKSVLDAFFLGKALAESINERVESAFGEILSAVGRLQADQQKQIQDFQEDVLQRARRAKEKAAREAMETQGYVPKSSTSEIIAVKNGVAAQSDNGVGTATFKAESTNEDPSVGVSNQE